ncbi:MAG: hypothetical protein FD174_3412 [Geobacteraceae bacterium]|nr:MAG: hypothetical protein FD174_3412 [Geobacteraceae bacterium]
MLKIVVTTAVIFTAGITAGCSGGSAGTPAATVSGVVADGYLREAEVFLDRNGNYQWDAGEPKTASRAGGAYTLSIASSDLGEYPVVCRAVAGSTVDEDTGQTVQNGYVISAPAGVTAFVSPMSSLIRGKMAANPDMTMAEAMTQLRNQFNMPSDVDMLADYVAGSQSGQHQIHYQTMRETARQMATLMAEQAPLVMNGSGVNVNRYRAMMGEINLNMPQIADNAMNGLGMDSPFMTAMRNEMHATLQNVPIGAGFMNYSGMFRNMTSHSAFWNYTGNRWQPGGMMGGGGMMVTR